MNRDWYSPNELAGKPGMPGTPRGVNGWGDKGKIERRKREKGKGWEYAFSSLPVETQAALLKEAEPAPAPVVPKAKRQATATGVADRESLWDAFERKPQSMKDEAARRLKALQAVDRLASEGLGRSAAVVQVAKTFGESRATVYRWQKSVKGVDRSDWLAVLVPAWAGRTARAECSPEAWEYFKAQFLRPEAPPESACCQWTLEAAREHGWTVPSERTLNRWVKEIPISTRVLARGSEEDLMRLYPSQIRTVRDLHALYWLNGDGYKHNVFVRFPDGTVDRPKTWFWQDVYSRRIVGFRTDRTEHTDLIRLALGDVLERFGIPGCITMDNTRAAANKWMTGGVKNRYRFKVKEEDPLGLMPQLGIDVHWTTVNEGKGHGQAKPVERSFGVGGLGEYVDKRYEFRGAYTGPNPQAKPNNYQSRTIEFAEFCKVLADAIRHWNEMTGRRTEICGGQLSFHQAFEESYQRNAQKIRRPTQAQRRMWLMMAESVTVHKDSTIALNIGRGMDGKNRYGCDALINYIGRKVVVRFDPDKLHETVHVYQADGRYIGEAQCHHAVGFGDSGAAREWARNRTQKIKAAKRQVAAERRMSELEVAEYTPALAPEDNRPVQTEVTRADFGSSDRQKAVAGSDIVDQPHQSPADKYGFNDAMARELKKFVGEN